MDPDQQKLDDQLKQLTEQQKLTDQLKQLTERQKLLADQLVEKQRQLGEDKPFSLIDVYLDSYRQHSAALRNWFVAYGIGASVLFTANTDIYTKLLQSGSLFCIGLTFLAGVVLQIFLSLCDKYADWICLLEELRSLPKERRPFMNVPKRSLFTGIAVIWMKQNVVSTLLDIASLVAFAVATWMTLSILTQTSTWPTGWCWVQALWTLVKSKLDVGP